MKNAMSKRVIALVMAASLGSTTVVEAAEIKKDESVFVNLSTSGELEKATVSNWIHADNSNLTIKDKTDLKDVKNVKGETEPTKSGQNLTWKMDGSDLYYQGTTDKELPIGVNVKYYLDNREMEPEDLSGKSGKVRIEVSLENKSYKEVEINGKQRKIYTPFTTATVVTLPIDKFSNVTTDGGNMLSEGNNNIVSFVAAPGLMESLGVDSLGIDLKLKDKMTIEADVENFSLGPVMVTASPNLLNLDDLDDVDENTTVTELKDKLDKLKDGMDQLVDGTGKLKSGIDSAKPKMEALFAEMQSSSMQEKKSLITDNNKVNGARTLIKDAFYAKDVPSSEARALLKDADSININDVKGKINKANGYIPMINSIMANADGDINKVNSYMPTINGLMANSDKYINKANGYMTTVNSVMGNADQYLSMADILAGDAQAFEAKKPVISLLYGTVSDLNNDKNFNNLMKTIESMDPNALENKLTQVSSKVNAISQVITPENLTMAKALLKDVKNVEPYSTKVQSVISEAIKNTPGNSIDEKTNNFIAQLNDSLTAVNQLSKLDATEINEKMQLINSILTTMPADFENYSEAYLTLKGYLGYALKTGTLDSEKAKLVKIISGVYADKPEVKNKLVNYINSFDASKFSPEALKQDEVKLNTYKKLFPEINAMMPKVNSAMSMLPKVQPMVKLAGSIAPAPEDINNLKVLFNDLQSNANTIKQVSNLIQNTSEADLKELSGMMQSANEYMSLLKNNKKYIEDIKKMAIAFNDKELINGIEKVKGDLDKTDALNVAKSLQGKIPEIKKQLPELKGDVSNAELMLKNFEGMLPGLKKDVPKIEGVLNTFKGKMPVIKQDVLEAEYMLSMANGKLSNIDNAKIEKVKEVSSKLLDMQKDLQDNQDILRITQDALSEGNVERARNLINSLPESEGKIKELIDGIGKLDEGANKYKTEGIDVLYDKGKDAASSIDEISLAKDEIVKASEEYGSFSGKADDMTGTTKFIMKTAEIEEAEPEETEVKEVKEEKKGFFAWLKSLFFK